MSQTLSEKWAPVLSHEDMPSIKDTHKKSVIAQVLENTETAIAEETYLTEASNSVVSVLLAKLLTVAACACRSCWLRSNPYLISTSCYASNDGIRCYWCSTYVGSNGSYFRNESRLRQYAKQSYRCKRSTLQ